MVRTALLMLAVASVAACAAPKAWYKEGSTDAEFRRTTARCRMQHAGRPPDPYALSGNQTQQLGQAMENLGASLSFMNDCMVAEGWELR